MVFSRNDTKCFSFFHTFVFEISTLMLLKKSMNLI